MIYLKKMGKKVLFSILRDTWRILREMWPENRLIIVLAVLTNLPIVEVVSLKPQQLQGDYLVTGSRRFWVPKNVSDALRRISDCYYIFPHRDYAGRHRTRQAVYRDMKRACRDLGMSPITPSALAHLYKPL